MDRKLGMTLDEISSSRSKSSRVLYGGSVKSSISNLRRKPRRQEEPYSSNNVLKSRKRIIKSEGDVSLKMLLDHRQSGTLIGSEGSLIKELMEVSGAR